MALSQSTAVVPSLLVGTQLQGGNFSIGKVLGQGGFGITYLGSHQQLRKPVAIKEFFPQGCARQGKTVQPSGSITPMDYHSYKVKSLEEAQILARFQSPEIVQVYTVFEENNTVYTVMQFLRGKTLQQRLDENAVILEQQALAYVEQIGQALAIVHQANLLHRDIKPENIMITEDNRAVLIDFGSARAFLADKTKRMTAMLTPGYAPLEQYSQEAKFGQFTDIYALGATLYHLLTGKVPTQATDRVLGSVLQSPQELNAAITPVVSDAVMAALAIRVEQRPQSIQEFLNALQGLNRAKSTIVVCNSGQGDYQTIDAAIANARAGDRILIRPGCYLSTIVITKPLEIIGDGENVVIETAQANCILMQTTYASVRRLILKGKATEKKQFTVQIPQGKLVMEDCQITSESLACVSVQGATTKAVLRNCRIYDGQSGGVLFWESAQGLLEDCEIVNHLGVGIEIQQAADPIIRNCKIQEGQAGGVLVCDRGKGTLENCTISGNRLAGVEIRTGGDPTIQNCRIQQGKASGVLVCGGHGTLKNCDISNNFYQGIAVYQGGNPTAQQCELRNNFQSGIWVYEQGTGLFDRCTISRNRQAGIQIQDKSQPVIRRCTISENLASGIYVTQGGKGEIEKCDIFGNVLAGISIRAQSEPQVRNCKIHDGQQGGIFVYEEGQGTIEDCSIYANASAGVEIVEASDPILQRCKIYQGQKGGVFVWNRGSGTLIACDIFANSYAGVEIHSEGDPTLQNCQIYDGKASGVLIWNRGLGKVESCTIFNNAQTGIKTAGSNSTIQRCSINSNGDYAVWVSDRGRGRIENCNLAGNAAGALQIESGCQVYQSNNQEVS
ncbi:serine/threonine protein kinase [Leptolyngbya boryana IAM M-101]|nr:serine/threonine protein kinase [Leptolyngbya boryana IAM M-101]BAS65855.1 serine/threonine protein kinase [Leptolyngbya boryana dg5]